MKRLLTQTLIATALFTFIFCPITIAGDTPSDKIPPNPTSQQKWNLLPYKSPIQIHELQSRRIPSDPSKSIHQVPVHTQGEYRIKQFDRHPIDRSHIEY